MRRHRPLSLDDSGQPDLSQNLADEIWRNAKPPKRTLRTTLRVPLLFVRRWLHRRRMERREGQPVPLDEYGLPVEWHHDDDYGQGLAEETRAEWERFETWANENGERPIRASVEAVLQYLEQLPGPERGDAYDAIGHKHESIYWHTGGCPHCELHIGYGLSVSDEGEMSFARKVPNTK